MIIDPTTYPDWATALAANDLLELLPGDYTGMGTMNFPILTGKTVRRYAGVPCKVASFSVVGGSGHTIEGLEFSAGLGCKIQNASGCTVRRCAWVDVGKDQGFTVIALDLIDVQSCLVERCTFRQTNYQYMGDKATLSLKAGLNGPTSEDNIIRECWFENCNDAIQLNHGEPNFVGPCPGTIIEGNKAYITDKFYTDKGATAENWLDAKVGGTQAKPVIVRNNEAWGYRPTDNTLPGPGPSGSSGQHVTVHVIAEWIVFENELYRDGVAGITIRNNGTSNLADHITVRNCRFETLRFYQGVDDSGKGIADYTPQGTDIVIENNIFHKVPIPVESENTVSGTAIYVTSIMAAVTPQGRADSNMLYKQFGANGQDLLPAEAGNTNVNADTEYYMLICIGTGTALTCDVYDSVGNVRNRSFTGLEPGFTVYGTKISNVSVSAGSIQAIRIHQFDYAP